MYDVFVFFIKDHESGERIFFKKKKCTETGNGLQYGYDDDNYYFYDIQNDLFTQVNEALIDHINEYCKRIKDFLEKEKEEYNQRFIIAVHPPGSLGAEELLEWQKQMKGIKETSNDIVYYSSTDGNNDYLKKHPEFNYDYNFLFDKNQDTDENGPRKKNFKIFLDLLKLRTGRKETDFTKVKKKLDDLYHIFFVKALACKGILECMEGNRNDQARLYYLESLGNDDFQTIVNQLKENPEVKNLEDVKAYKEVIYNSLQKTLKDLNPVNFQGLSSDTLENNKDKLKVYLDWYIDFLSALKKVL